MQASFVTKDYSVYIVEPDGKKFYFPYILCVPNESSSNILYVETNNEENKNELIVSARGTVNNILSVMSKRKEKSPVFVPVLPTYGYNATPYFQQLGVECFCDNLPKAEQRIDLQLVGSIEDARTKFLDITGMPLEEKVFMHGYSASGVLAQRFALLHPDIVGEVCIGGAIGSIPMPMSEYNGIPLDYPVGVHNYEKIMGKSFDLDMYKKIKFRYYVAELEDKRLSYDRKTEDGTLAPMHDMSYMDRSTPKDVGYSLRTAFGKDMFDRCSCQFDEYSRMGIDVSLHEPYRGITHNEIGSSAVGYILDCIDEYSCEKVKE